MYYCIIDSSVTQGNGISTTQEPDELNKQHSLFNVTLFTTGNYSSRSVWSCNAKIGHLIRMAVQTLNRLVCSGADLHDAECDEKLGPGRAPGGLLRLVLAAVSSHRHASKKVLPLGGVSRRIDRSSRCRRHRTRRFRGVSLRLL